MTKQHPDLSIAALFSLIYRERKFLGTLAIITVIFASIISGLLTEYFRSEVVIFPARINSLTLNDQGVRRGNISDFGEEEEAEQLLQIIESEELQDLVITKNNLYNHYDINRDDKYSRSKIRQKYNSNVSAKRTKYNSIEISVLDVDRTKAAEIANSISEFTDSVKNRMIRDRAKTSLSMIDEEQKRLQIDFENLSAQLDKLQEQGVVGEIERGGLYQAYGEALRNSDRGAVNSLREQLDINKEFGDEYDALKRRRDILTDQIMKSNSYRNQFIADAGINIPQKFVVDHAVPSDKKAYPVRWIVVAGALFSVMLFALIGLILKENRHILFKTR